MDSSTFDSKEKYDTNTLKRLNELLKKTEQFANFVSDPKPERESTNKVNESKLQHPGRFRSKRMTEAEEDEQLINDEVLETDKYVTYFEMQPPFITGGEMRDYQIEALNWLIRLYDSNINGILADEMGLGKTLEALALLCYLKEIRGISGPHLIIAPKSTLSNWEKEARFWCPSMTVLKFWGDKDERVELREKASSGDYDIIVCSYEMAIIEKGAFQKMNWQFLFIDEAHRIKNEKSVLSKIVRLYHTKNRLLITGTPLQNNLHELWALLNFLLPYVFNSADDFEQWFDISTSDDERDTIVKKLHTVLKPFLLRRLKADVETALPPKRETKLFIGMSAMQRAWYTNILLKNIDALNTNTGQKLRLLNIVMQLRKVCNHPYLFDGAEPGPPYFEGDHIVDNSGKMILLAKLLKRLKENGNRVLLFSQMTRLLDIIEDFFIYKGYNYCRMDGSTSQNDREDRMDRFNAPNSEIFVFLLSTRAGGLGINLQTADTVILYDSDWNPQMDLQAQDRCHRIGQKKEVHVYRFITEGSIEEQIIARADQKLFLDALVIQQGRLAEQHKNASGQELLAMIKFGADEIFRSKDATFTDEDLNVIMQKGQVRTTIMAEKLQKNASFTLATFSLDDSKVSSMYEYEGKDFSNFIQDNEFHFIEPPKRERKQTYDVDEYYRKTIFGYTRRSNEPPIFKPKQRYDFQFFDEDRLRDIEEKEWNARQKYRELKEAWKDKKREEKKLQKSRNRSVSQSSENENPEKTENICENDEKEEGKEEEKDDNIDETEDKEKNDEELEKLRIEAGCLTAEEEAERDKLESKGYSNWKRTDFLSLIRAFEHFGRSDLPNICESIPGKTSDEIRLYIKAFWLHGPEKIKDWDRLIQQIQKGEQKLKRLQQITALLNAKVSKYRDPYNTLEIPNSGTNRFYTEEEDRFLVCMMHELGYGNWEHLKVQIRRAWQFRFDWFLKSRTSAEIGRRCDHLVKLLHKEQKELEEKAKAKKRKEPPKSNGKQLKKGKNDKNTARKKSRKGKH